jgi:HEAT repeat protein/beta-lactamase regulating signal transducer with metallopeptidase domain
MNATHALGWALVHFVWQGAALAVLLGVALALMPQAAARARYALALATLGVMLILPGATALRLHEASAVASSSVTLSSDLETDGGTQPVESTNASAFPARTIKTGEASTFAPLTRLRAALDPALPWLVVAWLGGVLVLSGRLARGWSAARRLRTEDARPASPACRELLSRVATRLRVTRPVRLLESMRVDVPAVFGWLRPVILVPTSALTGLTPQQLEVLLAHELAHVRRHDYLMNLAQAVIETLLFYHPAVWWVSSRVREEREHCCDDVVVREWADAHLYASALLGMETLRSAPPPSRLALAASGTGGSSLLHRVRRLVADPAAELRTRTAVTELFPRSSAGVIAVTVALLATGGAQLAGKPASAPATLSAGSEGEREAADTTRTAPDTVLRHPDPAQTLAQRWEWARSEARRLNRRAYWIGYRVSRPAWLEHAVYIDREIAVVGQGITMRGHMFGDFDGLVFRGVRLGPLIGGDSDSDDIVIIFGVTEQGGRLAVTRVHVASSFLPMDFAGRTLMWLHDATDAQSLPVIEGLFAGASTDLKEDLVAAVGIHGTSATVVPILTRWLTGTEPTEVRAQAAEWLGFHPDPAAVRVLARAAREDRAGDVRREAAEALGENTLPAATDSAIAVARTANDTDVRREAVEGLGEKTDPRALAALVAIARSDPYEDVQREAVETLGEVSGERGMSAVLEIARTHPRIDVRREAVETLGEMGKTAETARVLAAIANNDASTDVQREAVETLGEIGELGLPAVIEIARTHPQSEVRREAIETLGEIGRPDSVIDLLERIARDDRDPEAAREAVETLGELHDARGLARVGRIARTHTHPDVQREAIETYAEMAPSAEALALLAEMLRGDASEDVYHELIETLLELPDGAGIPALIEAAGNHPSRYVRAEALRQLAESDDPRAQQVFERALRRP